MTKQTPLSMLFYLHPKARPSVAAAAAGLIFLFTLAGAAPRAEEFEGRGVRTVQAIGSGRIISSGVAQARERAVANGLVSAVGRVAWELMPENGMVNYFSELNQSLFADVNACVETYRVLAESTIGDTYRVAIEASISMDAVKKKLSDAGFIRRRQTLPGVLFLIAEQVDPSAAPRYWWGPGESVFYTPISESAMTRVLSESGYTVSGHQNAHAGPPVPAGGRLTTEDALNISRGTNAQVLVVGESWVEKSANVMGSDKRTFKGTVSLRVLRGDTGEEITRLSQSALVVDTLTSDAGERALAQAATLAAKSLSARIAAAWTASSAAYPGQISMVIEGTSHLGDFVAFRSGLKGVDGVKSIFIQEMKSDQAVIMVDYAGSPETLAEALMLNTYAGFGINIYEVGPDALKIRLVRE